MKNIKPNQLLSIREFSRTNPTFSEGSLRWYIQNSERYGLEGAFCRIGRRIFINPEKFLEVLLKYNSRAES